MVFDWLARARAGGRDIPRGRQLPMLPAGLLERTGGPGSRSDGADGGNGAGSTPGSGSLASRHE